MDETTQGEIRARAKQLADEAPAFTTEQALLLRSVWMRYPTARASDSGSAA